MKWRWTCNLPVYLFQIIHSCFYWKVNQRGNKLNHYRNIVIFLLAIRTNIIVFSCINPCCAFSHSTPLQTEQNDKHLMLFLRQLQRLFSQPVLHPHDIRLCSCWGAMGSRLPIGSYSLSGLFLCHPYCVGFKDVHWRVIQSWIWRKLLKLCWIAAPSVGGRGTI